MSDVDLIRSVTLDRDDYSAEFHTQAKQELENRDLSLETIIGQARIQNNQEPEEPVTPKDAVTRISDEDNLWSVWILTNGLGEKLLVQKESLWWSVHYVSPFEPRISYFVKTSDLEGVIRAFLTLENWQEQITEKVRLEGWEVLTGSDTMDYVMYLTQKLSKAEIPSTIKQLNARQCRGGGSIKIMVPADRFSDAQTVVDDLTKRIEHLYEQAESFDDRTSLQTEYDIYSELALLAPEDETVWFNKGVTCYELKRHKEAADAFIEAAFSGDDEEISDAVEEYLQVIQNHLSEDTSILHARANLGVKRGADPGFIKDLYLKILNIQPRDTIAHLHLGHLYYEDGDRDDDARRHFERFLEYAPEDEESEHVRHILKELESQ
jgi:tetratricopeptide (TPR) repeat protein